MWTLSKPIGMILVLLSTFLFSQPAKAKYSGGSGTAEDPYQIATAADLIVLGDSPADCDKHFILTADIDLDPHLPGRKVFDRAVIAPDTDALANGYQGSKFSGTLEGQGHRIVNMTISGGEFLGLFGNLTEGAVVSGLGLENINVSGTGSHIGGLAAFTWGAEAGDTVSNCYGTGTVSGHVYVGGLVGKIGRGTITNCHSSASVSGAERVGGLVGYNSGGVATSYSTGLVSGDGYVGGLVGANWDEGTVTQCYSTGRVSGSRSVGGLVGENLGTVTDCYNTGAVSGTERVGGVVGSNSLSEFGWDTPGSLTDCYSTGAVTGSNYVGGLVGFIGRVGNDRVAQCFWDIQTSGQATSAGGRGKTTAQMQMPSTFVGWGACGPFWTINEGQDYPHLAWENVPGEVLTGPTYGGGTGRADDPYLIYTAEQLAMIGIIECDWDKHFKLMGDIDLSGFDGEEGRPAFNIIAPATTIVCVWGHCWTWAAPFRGVFDGNRHSVSHLTIKGGTCLGVFGLLGPGGEVKDLGVLKVNISGSGRYIGGLAGWNQAGLVTQCYSTGMVSGDGRVGGLVGENDGSIVNSYSTASVSGAESVGGLVGSGGGLEDYERVTNCFWDIETSGQATSFGGTGKTTAEMQTAKTFLDAGWDFVNVWGIGENQTYPYLRKYSAADINQDAGVNFLDLAALAENWLK